MSLINITTSYIFHTVIVVFQREKLITMLANVW